MKLLTETKQKPVYSMFANRHLPQNKIDTAVIEYCESHRTTTSDHLFNLYMKMYMKYFDFVLVKDK